MAWHLASAGSGIIRRADRLQEHIGWRSRRAQGTARGHDSKEKTSREPGFSASAAATSMASWPAPDI